MVAWQKSAVEYNKLLQSVEKSKCIALKMALTNYAADNNFQALISTFVTETVPNHLEIFKVPSPCGSLESPGNSIKNTYLPGLYGYLQENHRSQFEGICRQLNFL
ncbi:BMA-RTEL-1 [Dirofilaria immitis]|nr:BMA-RTEL-1 [Dirofilaria immitis]